MINTEKNIPLFSLLLACFLFIFVLPIIPTIISWLNIALYTVIMVLAASSVSSNTKKYVVIAFIAVILEWATRATNFILIHYTAEITTNLFIVWIVSTLVIQIMQRKEVSIYTLLEALNGYLLLGIMFSSLVYFIDLHIPGSYSANRVFEMDLGYYTLITLTTTGYGDIAPITPIAKSLSVFIAIVGQFYVAVIVAILVGKYSNRPGS